MVVPAWASPTVPEAVEVSRYRVLLAGSVSTVPWKVQLVPESQNRVSARAPLAKVVAPTVTTVLAPVSVPIPVWAKVTWNWVLYVPVTLTELETVMGLAGDGAGVVSTYRLLVPAETGLE